MTLPDLFAAEAAPAVLYAQSKNKALFENVFFGAAQQVLAVLVLL